MKTHFAILCSACGLSQREAAVLLNVRPDTVRSWAIGRNPVPDGAMTELAKLFAHIHAQAENGLKILNEMTRKHGKPTVIDLNLASDDAEARSLGFPCASAQAASLGILIGLGMQEGHRFNVVPRGSTVAGAAAADEHDRIL